MVKLSACAYNLTINNSFHQPFLGLFVILCSLASWENLNWDKQCFPDPHHSHLNTLIPVSAVDHGKMCG